MEKQFFILENENIKLLPYLKPMVYKYNEWMQNDDLLEQTASERLNLQEELENQKSWCMDPKKYTFVIFQKNTIEQQKDDEHLDEISELTKDWFMCGDINIFFTEQLENNEAELTVMIAEKSSRNKGIAQQAIQIMMNFIYQLYQKDCFIVKISNDNTPSLSLFKKLDFKLLKEVEVFQEIHMSKQVQDMPLINYSKTKIEISKYFD